MTVQEMIDKLQECENKQLPLQILGEFNGKIENQRGDTISRDDVGRVIASDDYVGITRLISFSIENDIREITIPPRRSMPAEDIE